MNKKTRELLLECKKAGYEFVAICCVDKRVPISQKIEKGGEYWGQRSPHVICAAPNRRESGRPAIWTICENSTLTAGLLFEGCGCGESHRIRNSHNLDRGCYDLKEIA